MPATPPLEWYFDQNFTRSGDFEMPEVKNQFIELDDLTLIRFSETVKNETKDQDATVHFFEPDVRFDEVWRRPESYLTELGQYSQIMTPDFSMDIGAALPLQILNTFRNRWCGWYWQQHGMTVIPTVSWADDRSFEFAFSGLPEESVLAISTVGCRENEERFMTGFDEMCARLNPEVVICYGEPFDAMTKANPIVVPYSRTTRTTTRR